MSIMMVLVLRTVDLKGWESHTVMLGGQIPELQLSVSLKLSWSRSCEMFIASVSVLWCLWLQGLSCPYAHYNSLVYLLLYLPLVDGSWNEWSGWSACSASCSNGTMQRTRECNGPSYGGSECHGTWMETANCFLKDCPGKITYLTSHIQYSLCK